MRIERTTSSAVVGWLLAILFGSLPLPAWAAETALSLQDCMHMALQRLPQVGAGTLRVRAAEAEVSSARGAYVPVTTLRAGVELSHVEQFGETGRSRAFVTDGRSRIELIDFGARRHGVRGARAGVELARADLASTRLGALLDVTELYLMVLRDERRIEDAELSVAIQDQQVSTISRLVQQKARPQVDLQRAEVQRQAARDNVEVLKAEHRRDRVSLALSLGVDSIAQTPLVRLDASALPIPETAAEASASALKLRPERSGAQALQQGVAEQAKAAGAALAPRIGVEGSLSTSHPLHVEGTALPPERTLRAAIGAFVTWDGLDPVAWGARRARQAEAEAAAMDLRALEREIRANALAAFEERARAAKTLERARHLSEGARAALEAQQKRYELGAASLLELLDAQALDQGARAQVIDAELGEGLARVRLLADCGLLTVHGFE